MDARIKWSTRAVASFKRISKRIKREYGKKVAFEFADKLVAKLDQLASHPKSGRPVGTNPTKRRAKLDKVDYIRYNLTLGRIRVLDIISYKKK